MKNQNNISDKNRKKLYNFLKLFLFVAFSFYMYMGVLVIIDGNLLIGIPTFLIALKCIIEVLTVKFETTRRIIKNEKN